MTVNQKITIDLLGGGKQETVHVVQGDAYSRIIALDLRQWRSPWIIPDGVSAIVEYYKPDGTKGLYDTLPDGTEAWSAKDNILTVHLAPQMLTATGTVVVQVRMMKENAVLSLFKFHVFVHQKITGVESEDYTNWRSAFIPQVLGANVGQYLEIAEVDKDGRAIKLTPVDAPQGGGINNESDPTVSEWAKQPNKPTYTAEEVGALPKDTEIPSIDGLATEEYVDNAIESIDIPDWNAAEGEPGYIANRTHWIEGEGGGVASNTLTYDGNKQGRAGVDMDGDGVYDFVKVSDAVPSPDQLVGAKLTISTADGDVEEILTADLITDMTGTGMLYVLVSPTVEMAGVLVPQDVSEDGMTVEKGIYFAHVESPDMSFRLKSITATTPIFGGGEVIHKLDNKFLDLEWMAAKGQEQYEGDVLLAVEFNENHIGGGYNYADREECVALGKIKEGDNVVVIWDGKEYALTAQKVQFTFDNEELTVLTAGNIGGMWLSLGVNIGVPATGEPFSVSFGSTNYDTGVYSDACSVFVATEEGEGTHTVSIYAKSTLERMPEKYLPESVASKEYVTKALEELGSGGNGKAWRKIAEFTLEEDLNADTWVYVNNDADGSELDLLESCLIVYAKTNGNGVAHYQAYKQNNANVNYVATAFTVKNSATLVFHCEAIGYDGEKPLYIRTTATENANGNATNAKSIGMYKSNYLNKIAGMSLYLPSCVLAGTKYEFWGVDR